MDKENLVKVRRMSEEQKKKLSKIAKERGFGKWMKGRHLSEETKKKIIKNHRRCQTEETKKKLRELAKNIDYSWLKGRKVSEDTKQKLRKSHLDKRLSDNTKKKISETRKRLFKEGKLKSWNKGKEFLQIRGEKHPQWKGGITPINIKVRMSLEYKLWREAVFKRDNYTCIWCGARSGNGKAIILHADHIKPFIDYPELRFALDNGRTLCIDCHKKTDTYAGKGGSRRKKYG